MTANLTRRSWLATAGSAALATRLPAATTPTKPLQGAFMILSTPYTESKAVDYEDLAGQVDFLERCGSHALVWPQNASEQTKLTKDEKMRGMEVIAKAAKGRRPALVLGVQGADTAEMLEYAQHAESLAPTAMIAMPPTKATSLDDFRKYFRALCKATTRPIFIQTSGGAPQILPTVDFIIELSKEFPHFGYVKEEHDPVIPRMQALMAKRPDPIKRVFGANRGAGFLYQMRLGSDGTIIGGVPYAEIYTQLWDLHREEKLDQQRELFGKLLLMLNLDHEIPGVRAYILKKRGLFKTMVSREADYQLGPQAIAEIDYNFEALKPYLKA